jgi:hypothetical protein
VVARRERQADGGSCPGRRSDGTDEVYAYDDIGRPCDAWLVSGMSQIGS